LLEVIYHYLDVTGRPASGEELRGLVDSFDRRFQGRPLVEMLAKDPRFSARGNTWSLVKWQEGEVFTVVDVETTGLSPARERITEVALLRIIDGQEAGRWTTLINPGRPIPPYITRITRIDDQMVAQAPRFPEVARKLLDFMGSSVLVAHNASFDLGFLNTELKRAGQEPLNNKYLDTVTMARALLPYLPNRKLVTVAQHYQISTQGHHRAMADVIMTSGIFQAMLAEIHHRGEKPTRFIASS
jgi:DNA polymerase III epsilon subunit family exonuclease